MKNINTYIIWRKKTTTNGRKNERSITVKKNTQFCFLGVATAFGRGTVKFQQEEIIIIISLKLWAVVHPADDAVRR